jgi:hypothetical protein
VRKAAECYLFITLLTDECTMYQVFDISIGVIDNGGTFATQSVGTRPETFTESTEDRSDQGLVRMVFEEQGENIDFNRGDKAEKLRTRA